MPVLVGAAGFDGSGKQGVAFVVDLTERKRAEAEARESERRYREVQMELAHANRVATMGQLSASIAHEVNQPIAATAHQCRRPPCAGWTPQPPNLEKARQALGRIVENSNRAGDVVGRIRALIKKAPPRKDDMEINEAILEVIALTRGEAVKNGVSVRTQLAEGLPLIHGDRVQLQQVILNLIINAIEAMSGAGEGSRELLISTGDSRVRTACSSRCGIRARGWRRRASSASSRPSTRPSPAAWGWGCRSAARSSKRTADDCGRPRMPRGAVFQFTVPAQLEANTMTIATDG